MENKEINVILETWPPSVTKLWSQDVYKDHFSVYTYKDSLNVLLHYTGKHKDYS